MLNDFATHFNNTYQEQFPKILVAKDIMNMRFEPTLTYGQSVARVAYDISNVLVRTVVRGAASTIDAVTDAAELLTINIEKEAVFYLSDGEKTQAGPLNPGAVIGGQIALKVAADLDARCFAEVVNAAQTFDTGDLTTTASNGTPITLSATTVPQMVAQMPAKLRHGYNQTLTNLAFVVDSYTVSQFVQYLLGKQFDIVNSVWKNGQTDGQIAGAEVYISENLTSDSLLTFSSGLASDADTITVGGVVFTLKTTLSTGPAVAGEVLLGANFAATITNLAAAMNAAGTTSSTFTALSAANQVIWDALKVTATGTATTLRIVGAGVGRMSISESATNVALTNNYMHAYYGKKGAIDLVVQDMKEVDIRPTADRRGSNIFTSYLAGLKTFADGAKKFLDVKILVS